ncbi:MAG: hypothetical protein IPM74_18025 [Crocinitomicaceae bacterium]|nr:hypothetical protein [Crocinitomicaceae bacterium]
MNRLFFYIIFVFGSSILFGQDNELYDHRLDDKKWEEIRRNIRYENRPQNDAGREWTYENREDYQRAQRDMQRKRNGGGGTGQGDGGSESGGSYRPNESESYDYEPPPSAQINPPAWGGMGALGYILLILLVGVLAFLIYYLFVNRARDGAKVKPILDLDEQAPTEIPLTELQKLLRDALARNDYRAAVRIYFIFILRDLSQKRWIEWQKEKTNYHYLREMSENSLYSPFSKSVGYFEVIWYGKREIDQQTFDKIQPEFKGLLDKLG